MYELFYSDGGHGGPYSSYDLAKYRAIEMIRGCHTTRSIRIHPRTVNGVGGYGAVIGTISRETGGFVSHTYHPTAQTEMFGSPSRS